MKVGLIGTGIIGNGIGRCLFDAGHTLTVHDLRREAAANLLDLGGVWADTPRAVAETSDVVFTSLPGPREVESVVLDPVRGLLAGFQPERVYIDMTTNSPARFRRIAELCKKCDVAAMDAPLSGKPPESTIMVGGDKAIFDKYSPLLGCIGRRIFYAGETGMWMTAKAVNQFVTFANFMVQAEGLLIGAKAGLNIDTLAQIIGVSSGRSLQLGAFPRVVFRGGFDLAGGGTLNRWIKDLSCTREIAGDAGWVRILKLTEQVSNDAQAHGWGEQVWQGAARVLEEIAGVKLRTSTEDQTTAG